MTTPCTARFEGATTTTGMYKAVREAARIINSWRRDPQADPQAEALVELALVQADAVYARVCNADRHDGEIYVDLYEGLSKLCDKGVLEGAVALHTLEAAYALRESAATSFTLRWGSRGVQCNRRCNVQRKACDGIDVAAQLLKDYPNSLKALVTRLAAHKVVLRDADAWLLVVRNGAVEAIREAEGLSPYEDHPYSYTYVLPPTTAAERETAPSARGRNRASTSDVSPKLALAL